MKICEDKIQKEVIFIMRNSNKTREKIMGVLIELVFSVLCVTSVSLLLASVFFLSEGEERLAGLLCAILLFCLSELILRIC